MSSTELFQWIKKNTKEFSEIEGVTFSGGEPFSQANRLAEVAKMFQNAGLSVMSYSGLTIEEIGRNGLAMRELLSQLDILVDGEYVRELSCNRLWRSSTNQRVHFLTKRYLSHVESVDKELREFEVVIGRTTMNVTGFPEKFAMK